MKNFTLLFLLMLLFSCSKTEQQSKTCIPPVNLKLVESIECENAGGRQWTENYSYDSADRLIKIETSVFDGQIFDLEYSDDNLTKVNVTNMTTNSLERIDSLTYDLDGNVSSAYTFSLSPFRDDFAPWFFEYDDQGRIKQLSSDWRILKFTWSGDNISKVEHFDENQERLYDATYEFDDKINYEKGMYQTHLYAAYNFMRPEYWNKNNISQSDRLDHIEFQYDNGTTEHGCPCGIEYDYDDDCFPVRSTDGGLIKNITYR